MGLLSDIKLTVRQLELSDHEKIVDYFLNADKAFLKGIGVDTSKLPSKQDWLKILEENFYLGIDQKKFYYIIWLLNDRAVGHSNINKIVNGKEAYMHLHIWQSQIRQQGIGIQFLKLTIPFYFQTYGLENLFCEPSASNLSPNRTLKKLGFDFIKSYDTTPGWINFYQTVNRWSLTREKFENYALHK